MITKFYNWFNLHRGEENKNKVREDVIKNISFKGANLWILACAILIASIGLNVNSTAVIIGAMLISPLMGPIVGSGFALATYDINLLKRSTKNLLIATAVGFLVSALFFYISPFKDVQSELLARTSPTIYDVLIAFFGGIVGAVSITREDKGNPIPGVAIATALMPPLCTAGFGFATMNYKFVAGALYLYSINCFFIGIATFLVLKYLKYKPIVTKDEAFDKKVRVAITIMVSLLVIPSFYLAYNLLEEKKFVQNVEKYFKDEFTDKGMTIIYKKFSFNQNPKRIDVAFLSEKFDSIEIHQLNQKLKQYNLPNTKLVIKQNNSDLNNEILMELQANNTIEGEKDIRIKQLMTQINQLNLGDFKTDQEIKILFPNINKVSFGKTNLYVSKDSVITQTLLTYSAVNKVDEVKLRQWLNAKFEQDSIIIIKE
ncbi:DUF389 domain-containing protein [Faecalibacter rhinopitheci]|uniref:DUF389 domain-containing protein n=1 Tax=Faecalibacter rhinopitheci TaxID=2779678 RepID=A0A8J7FNK7_9FLAO|nr:DUF389 domain-containing protein [Faecalibacter rhinopitheci]MBF0596384.1 DUF389 domain-containing protein [Faecalibacter rhinopitheci]